MNIKQLAWRNFKCNTSISIIIALTIVTMMVVSILNISAFVQQAYEQTIINQVGDTHAEFANLTLRQARIIKEAPEIEQAIELTGINQFAFLGENGTTYTPIISISPLSKDKRYKIIKGHEPDALDEVALTESVVDHFGHAVTVGDRIKIKIGENPDVATNQTFLVTAILEDLMQKNSETVGLLIVSQLYTNKLYLGSETYGRTENDEPMNSRQISVLYKSDHDVLTTTEFLAEKANIYDERDARVLVEYLEATMQSSSVMIPLLLILLAFVCISVLVIYNIFTVILNKRLKQYGLLSIIGMSHKQIVWMAELEAFFSLVIALPIGLLTGTICFWAVSSTVFRNIVSGQELRIVIQPFAYLSSVLVVMLTLGIGISIPVYKLVKIPALKAVHSSGYLVCSTRKRLLESVSITELSKINLWRVKRKTIITLLTISLAFTFFCLHPHLSSHFT